MCVRLALIALQVQLQLWVLNAQLDFTQPELNLQRLAIAFHVIQANIVIMLQVRQPLLQTASPDSSAN